MMFKCNKCQTVFGYDDMEIWTNHSAYGDTTVRERICISPCCKDSDFDSLIERPCDEPYGYFREMKETVY